MSYMRIVIDTNKWHPLVRRFMIIVLVVIVVNAFFWIVEECTEWDTTWWRGYILGFVIGMISAQKSWYS